jgi:hypothetical protein
MRRWRRFGSLPRSGRATRGDVERTVISAGSYVPAVTIGVLLGVDQGVGVVQVGASFVPFSQVWPAAQP